MVTDQMHKEKLLIKEIGALRTRLEESEAVAEVFRQGDAVVVCDPSKQVYTFTGIDRSYRVLIEAISEGALVSSASGAIAYCNHRFAEMLKTTAKDLTESSLFRCVEPGELNAFKQLLQAALTGNSKGDFTLRAEGGSLLSSHFSMSPLVMGDFRGVCAVVTDLTEQKLIEEELRKHRSELERLVEERTEELRRANDELEHRVWERTAELVRTNAQLSREVLMRQQSEAELRVERDNFRKLSQEFHTLLNAINDTLILISPDMKVLWTNYGNTHHLKDEPLEAVQQYSYKLLHDLSMAHEGSPVARCFHTGEKEVLVATNNGIVLDIRVFPIKEGERVGSVLLLASDITEKMALQAEAIQACHLASLGELAAGVAHEINNPITGIINYGQILINECGEESMERDIGKRVVKEGERIGRIVKTLLSYARDDEQMGKRAAYMSSILEESIILTQAQMRKEGIDLEIDFPDNLPEVDVNFQQIQQSFINIISNARYALNAKHPGRHKDKLLRIIGEKVVIDDHPYVRIVFHDQGVGISSYELPILTKAFFSTKPFGKGTGLGLNITDRIITEHGGFLRFESIKGEFTKVIIDLPAKVDNECQNSCN